MLLCGCCRRRSLRTSLTSGESTPWKPEARLESWEGRKPRQRCTSRSWMGSQWWRAWVSDEIKPSIPQSFPYSNLSLTKEKMFWYLWTTNQVQEHKALSFEELPDSWILTYNNSNSNFNIFCVPTTTHRFFTSIHSLNLTASLCCMHDFYSQFIDEQTDMQKLSSSLKSQC